jgi:hypothetical protein
MEIISDRKKFDKLLHRHKALKFMNDGRAGRIQYKVIPSEYDDDDRPGTILFKDMGRSPIFNNSQFRRSFPLSSDYKLMETTCLHGNSPKEELLLFANRSLFNINHMKAIVSLLNPRYIGTAFRVSPEGGFLTCYENLSLNNNDNIEELWINQCVYSPSYEWAGKSIEKIDFVSKEQNTAFLRSSSLSKGPFLIPCADKLTIGEAVVCIGYPGKVDSNYIKSSYYDLLPSQIPSLEEYQGIFESGNLSVSPGPVLSHCPNTISYDLATIPGFSGSPVCLLEKPRMFIGINYQGRHENTSVKDENFYHFYSTFVVPELREVFLSQEDIELINNYLCIGETPLIKTKTI